jgi:hypothetical protein
MLLALAMLSMLQQEVAELDTSGDTAIVTFHLTNQWGDLLTADGMVIELLPSMRRVVSGQAISYGEHSFRIYVPGYYPTTKTVRLRRHYTTVFITLRFRHPWPDRPARVRISVPWPSKCRSLTLLPAYDDSGRATWQMIDGKAEFFDLPPGAYVVLHHEGRTVCTAQTVLLMEGENEVTFPASR